MLRPDDPRRRPPPQALRAVVALDGLDVRGRRRARSSVPRRERRRQDDDDADRPRRPRGRRRPGHLATAPTAASCRARPGATCPRSAGSTRGCVVLDQLVFFAGLHGVPPRRRPARGDRLARPVPGQRPRRAQGGGALQGQPAEDPVHRGDAPRPAGPADGRAVHRPRPGQRRRSCARRSSSSATAGRTVVFSTHQMETAEAMCESVAIVDRGRVVVGGSLRDVRRADRPADRPHLGRGRPPAAWLAERARRADHPAGDRAVRDRAGRRAPSPRRSSRRRSRPAPGSATSRSPTRRSSRSSSTTSAGRPTRTPTWRPPTAEAPRRRPPAPGREDAA